MQLRTGKGENPAVESEPDATSDRRRRNPRGGVRTWSHFGQEEWKSGRSSLNLEPLRTGEEEIRTEEPNLILIRGMRDSAVLSYSTSNLHIEKRI
ncbi:hypothetical protein LIT38_04300 [Bacillus sp. CMF12]|uniref:hypothetical protein n=1 Tax=Bacillaceae TaxID=186817 RepID=UPI001FB475E3|nr:MULTISPECIES: hypothetical protein [Bacillaceae]UOE56207.1 hypothetical protein IRB79_05470 [Cytobacillus oceanisediminis]USK50691.1 hypothetical protein LIT38_04300 [Bacillus sp. CMF12]